MESIVSGHKDMSVKKPRNYILSKWNTNGIRLNNEIKKKRRESKEQREGKREKERERERKREREAFNEHKNGKKTKTKRNIVKTLETDLRASVFSHGSWFVVFFFGKSVARDRCSPTLVNYVLMVLW